MTRRVVCVQVFRLDTGFYQTFESDEDIVSVLECPPNSSILLVTVEFGSTVSIYTSEVRYRGCFADHSSSSDRLLDLASCPVDQVSRSVDGYDA